MLVGLCAPIGRTYGPAEICEIATVIP
jgi:hypothetical protein